MIELSTIELTLGKGTPLENPLFKGLNLQMKTGEFVTLIGSNGAGKSSLLNLIAGELQPQKGRLLLDGIDATNLYGPARAALVARVFQDPMLGSFAELSIEENLAIACARGRARGLKAALNTSLRNQFGERLKELDMGLENRMQESMGLLSGGQRQAIHLVMATLSPSKILLLDEPTAALDPRMREKILELIQQFVHKYRLTTLMITHCMSQAFMMGTRTLILHQGCLMHDLEGEKRKEFQQRDLIELF